MQGEPSWGGRAPPWGTALTVPVGVPRRGKVGAVPHGGRVSRTPRSSRGTTQEGGHLLPGRHPAQTLARTVVQKRVDPLEFRLADSREGRLLGVEPADQTIGVLVRAPFPGMVGLGKIDVQPGRPRHLLVPGKLLSVIQGQAYPSPLRKPLKQLAGLPCHLVRFFAVRPTDQRKPRTTFHQSHQVPRLMRPVDQVTFPMPDALPRLHLGRSGIDHSLIRNPASPSPLLTRTAPMPLTPRTGKIIFPW